MFIKSVSFFIFFLILSEYLTADTPAKLEINSSYRYTYKDSMGDKNEFFFHGKQKIGDHLILGGGFSTAFNSLPETFFFNFDINGFPSFFRYRISFLSRDFPLYEFKENSIYPTIALLTKYFEMELGISYRILGSETQSATTHTLYRLQFNILDNNLYGLRFRLSNFDLYRAGNISDLYYILENSFKVTENFIISADLGFQNAGQLVFSSYYSTIYGQIGVRYRL